MSVCEFTVIISPAEAMDVIDTFVVSRSISGTLVDRYVRRFGEQEVHVIVLEKYCMRSSNRASLTVTTDNFEGQTKVHAVASGGSQGMFMCFDWGAGNDFANSVESALGLYLVG